jgi:hypothetical protein
LCLEKPSRYGFSQGSPRNVIVSPLLTLEREPEIHLIDSNFVRLIHAFMPRCYGELGFTGELGGEFFCVVAVTSNINSWSNTQVVPC